MDSVTALARIARADMEIIQGEVAALERAREELAIRREHMAGEFAAERAAAGILGVQAMGFGQWSQRHAGRMTMLDRDRERLEAELEARREALTAAHVEVKKLERLTEMREEDRRRAEARRDAAEADERAVLMAARAKRGG
jgi:flagellar export protein FliJ